ncbi:MAG: hypothetical protein ACFFDT_08090, partial [Candidatus Hodarchaeota archaeon]
MLFEGIFRRPRLWSNIELRKFAPIFNGDVINVSGAQDSDKEINNLYKYFFTRAYDVGNRYEDYFVNANNYFISNYEKDDYRGHGVLVNKSGKYINLDLNEKLPEALLQRFDVVFSHTVLEHVFDIFQAFKNLCMMSKDIVIVVVPFIQRVHDYRRVYKDYWRLTPFAVDELFKRNGFTVLYRSSNRQFSSSIYYFYIATRKPEKWENRPEFSKSCPLNKMNLGQHVFIFSYLQL